MEKIKRLATVNTTDGAKWINYELPKTPNTEYIVDDSCFIPMAEAIKQLKGSRPMTDEEIKMCYDFPDGVDNGMEVPIHRKHGIADITEITQDIVNKTHEISEKVEQAKAEEKANAEFNAKLNAISSPKE